MSVEPLNLPLMKGNIARADLDAVIDFLKSSDDPILTQSANVRRFEEAWSEWLGVRYSVFVNSGSSANLITMGALRERVGGGEVIVPTITWVSDIASVVQSGFTPVFADIDPQTLGMDTEDVLKRLTPNTRAVFLTHVLGYDALTDRLLDELRDRNILLIEDVCESYGATHRGRKLGTFGWASNFSFYYAHHMTTIEGGMVSTDDLALYETLRMFRSHGMTREASSPEVRREWAERHADLNPDFIFAFPGYNVRSTEINAVIGLSQLKRLDENNLKRVRNLDLFLSLLDGSKYRTDFRTDGSCSYAFTLILNEPDGALWNRVEAALREARVEFRRGTAGGGNQLRQPYARQRFGELYRDYPQADHVHFYGCYIGNYPDLQHETIRRLCALLNGL